MGAVVGQALLEAAVLVAAVTALALPFSSYVVKAMEGCPMAARRVLGPLERGCERLVGADDEAPMGWKRYLLCALALTAVGCAGLFAILLLQGVLPANPEELPGLPVDTAFNVAASFATNTDWQAVAGESHLSYFSQAVGLTVENFLSPAVGVAVAFALMRGLWSRGGEAVGNFFVDVTRALIYVLVPLALVGCIVGMAEGIPQTLEPYETVQLVEPVAVDGEGNVVAAGDPSAVREVTEAVVPLGPQASQVSIKQIGTNGGGFNGANSASSLENPTPLTNLLQCGAIMLLPLTLIFCFGRMVADRRQGRALMTAVLVLLAAGVAALIAAEFTATPQLAADGAVYTGALGQSAGNMEGKEVRIGTGATALWTALTTAAANGSSNGSLAGLTPLGLVVPLVFMGVGEVVGGGVGTGLASLLGFTILTVFIASLMVGRAPEYLGKKIGPAEMRLAVVMAVAPSLLMLAGAAVLVLVPAAAQTVGGGGPEGFANAFYAAVSTGANNGSALGGFNADTPWANGVLGAEMILGRVVALGCTMALAGRFAACEPAAQATGSLSTASPLFVVLLMVIVVLVGALTLVPALALGPVALAVG
ncbi:potassium-transporting ATPase subunit KdpA [uncultured Adlercreutzia sp.]|uniref:potassium-transporting ATPase subunit KdpA n=1 Tax=uncultured Adlercreutzia sp. TaxID=875803 RepID=UPI0026F3D002|nr:potassium-transporting ATPase subunit KdpA [uncultured Adlercreutzia sp.]